MVDPDTVTAKLAELGDRIARIEARCPATAEDLAADRDAMDIVSFNLMLAVQCALDIASHLIADEGWEPAVSLAAAFMRLRDRGVVSPATAAALAKGAGLRNVVAHGYSGVDVARVHSAATSGLADLRAFASELAAWLVSRREASKPAGT